VLSELRDLAERVVYLVDGQKRYDGGTSDLLRTMQTDDLERAVARLMEAGATDEIRGRPAREAS
jgi:hypothetical protein